MMRKLFAVFFVFCSFVLHAAENEEAILRRVRAGFLLSDFQCACNEAERGVQAFPASDKLKNLYLQSLALAGYEQEAIGALGAMERPERSTLENVSWGVIKKGLRSVQYPDRLIALISAFLINDAKAVGVMLEMMQETSAVLRSVATQLACHYGDLPLKEQISKMLREERVWQVRLEVIKAIGKMRMQNEAPALKLIAVSSQATYEEKAAAVESLAQMSDDITDEELSVLANSKSADLRLLATKIMGRKECPGAKAALQKLVADSRADVKVAALDTICASFLTEFSKDELVELLKDPLEHVDPAVALSAARIALIADMGGVAHFRKLIFDGSPEIGRQAAAVLASGGPSGVKLLSETVLKAEDSFVRVNAALGLIRQRQNIQACCGVICAFLENNHQKIMWTAEAIEPSNVRHIDQIQNYPEALDQVARLRLLSQLAILGDSRAAGALKSFLKNKKWGLSGMAVVMLLQEGDDASMDCIKQLLFDPDPELRLQSALVLTLYGKDEEAAEVLKNIYFDQDVDTKLYILEALGYVSGPAFFDFFVKAMNEPFAKLRIASASALIQAVNR